MTLMEFCAANEIKPMSHRRAPNSRIVPDKQYPNRQALWNLSDYIVSSCQAGSIWLQPRGN